MRIVILGLLICYTFACSAQDRLDKDDNNGDPVYHIDSEDSLMNAAIDKAKASYSTFEEAWKKQSRANAMYTVKLRLTDAEENIEHMWLVDLFKKGDSMYGILDNTPATVKNVAAGDTIKIEKDHISDWMYVRKGKLVGGYTLRVLYDRMSAEEREQFKQEVPFSMD